jgi:hypothetical protein
MKIRIVMDFDDIKGALLFRADNILMGGVSGDMTSTHVWVKLKNHLGDEWFEVEDVKCEFDVEATEVDEE